MTPNVKKYLEATKQPKKSVTTKTGLKRKVQKRTKRPTSKILVRLEQNPIISPRPENKWETWQTFNPGVISLDNKVHFLYRAIGEDGISRFGYAVSNDGFIIDNRLPYPVYEHKLGKQIRNFNIYSFFSGGSFGGSEDPRLVRVDEESVLYVTYTACDNGLRVALTSIKVDDFLNNKWKWRPPVLISPPDEIHKNWLIFPEKINNKYVILHSIKPTIQIEYVDSLEFDDNDYINSFHGGAPRKRCWDKWLRGAGAPPLKTKEGWLLFYHAMDNDWSKYKVGAMLLDLNDPTKILYRSKNPVLVPEEPYENNGYKPGVVYVSGAVVKDGDLLVYYGCSDNYISVAYAPLEEFLEALKKETRPKLKLKTLKKKYDVN
ncbi:MAG: glycosidase [Patescibacteria group bacterium]|nr:glycosidase [Patescibacteria group bacterium]